MKLSASLRRNLPLKGFEFPALTSRPPPLQQHPNLHSHSAAAAAAESVSSHSERRKAGKGFLLTKIALI
jgi:hypothetical protein